MALPIMRRIGIGLGLVAASLAISAPTVAQIVNQTHCGIASPSGGVVAAAYYDPFNPAPVSNQAVTLTLARFVGSAQDQKTQQVNFYFVARDLPAGMSIIWNGMNVLYPANGSGLGIGAPALSLSNSCPGGTVCYNFGANTNLFAPAVTISIPPGLDLSNGLNLQFDIVYACNGTGSKFANVGPSPAGTLMNAMTLPVYVLNALQAYYAGPPLDFGPVGAVDNAALQATPGAYIRIGYVHVASSGPYVVDMKSRAANPFRMTYQGGDTARAGHYIPYKATLLGQTLDNASPLFRPVSCVRAGVTAGVSLPISVALEEGGADKVTGAYQDQLEVTITPLVAAPSPRVCY